jgi:hypothetical protein
MAEPVEFLSILWMVCLKLFPLLICFDENANGGWIDRWLCGTYIERRKKELQNFPRFLIEEL